MYILTKYELSSWPISTAAQLPYHATQWGSALHSYISLYEVLEMASDVLIFSSQQLTPIRPLHLIQIPALHWTNTHWWYDSLPEPARLLSQLETDSTGSGPPPTSRWWTPGSPPHPAAGSSAPPSPPSETRHWPLEAGRGRRGGRWNRKSDEPRKRRHTWISYYIIGLDAHLDLPPACSGSVLTHSSGEHPHLPSICIPKDKIKGMSFYHT